MEKIIKTYALFEGRPDHELPPHMGALCLGFDFSAKKVERSPKWNEAILAGHESEVPVEVRVIVTGLTPAMAEFMAAFIGTYTVQIWDWYMKPQYHQQPVSLVLMHWDRETKTYWDQVVF